MTEVPSHCQHNSGRRSGNAREPYGARCGYPSWECVARDLPVTRRATAFARDWHGDQLREGDGAPFLVHPLEVASHLERAVYPDHVVAAAVLHDVLEDTDAEPSELQSQFGHEVSELVAVVSDDPSAADEEQAKG